MTASRTVGCNGVHESPRSFPEFEIALDRALAELRAMGLPEAYEAHNARCRAISESAQPDLFKQCPGIVASPDETPAPGALHLSAEDR